MQINPLFTQHGASRGIAWKDQDVEELIELIKEETIVFSLKNAKTPKEKRAAYKTVQVQLQNKGNVCFSLWQILHTETCTHFKMYCEVFEVIRLGRE